MPLVRKPTRPGEPVAVPSSLREGTSEQRCCAGRVTQRERVAGGVAKQRDGRRLRGGLGEHHLRRDLADRRLPITEGHDRGLV